MDDRIYRKVEIDVWEASDFRALSRPKPNAQTLWLWLLSCPRTVAIPGVIKGRLSAMAGDLEWPLRSFRKCLDEIVAAGMAEVDEAAGLVVLTRALLVDGKPRPTARPRTKNTAKAWGDAFIKLPSCALLDSLTARLRTFFDQIGGEIANVFAERVGWSTVGVSVPPPVECGIHHGTQGSGIRDQGSSDPLSRAREAMGPLVDHAIDRLNAARRKVDPTASPIPLIADQPCRELLDHLRPIDAGERMAVLDRAIDVMLATLDARRDPVGEYRMAMLSGEKAWARWRDGTVAGARGRDGPAGRATGRAPPARIDSTDEIDPTTIRPRPRA